MLLDGTRAHDPANTLCVVVKTTARRRAGPSCSRKGVLLVWWSDLWPRVRVCKQHAKHQRVVGTP